MDINSLGLMPYLLTN